MLSHARYLEGKSMFPGQTRRIKKRLGKENVKQVLNMEKENEIKTILLARISAKASKTCPPNLHTEDPHKKKKNSE